jgi:D-galactarolactone cycloisomerase
LEFDTTHNTFRDALLQEPLDIQGQVARSGSVAVPNTSGIGVRPDRAVIERFRIA